MNPKPSHLIIPPVLRGSLILLRRKCGKPNCHCAQGTPHDCPALSYSQRGKTHLLTLPPAQLSQVRTALQRYRRGVQRLERQAHQGLGQLARQLRRIRSAR